MTKKEIFKLETVVKFLATVKEQEMLGKTEYTVMDGCPFSVTDQNNATPPRYTVRPKFVDDVQDNDKIIRYLEDVFGLDFVLNIDDTSRPRRGNTNQFHRTFKVVFGDDDDNIDIDDIVGIEPKIVWRNKIIEVPANATNYAIQVSDLDAVCKADGTITYSVAVGDLLNIGRNSVTATFTPTDTVKYKTSMKKISIKIVNLP